MTMTISGRNVKPDNNVVPTFYDVGFGLAGIRRYAGHSKPWTVLQHSFACERFALYRGWAPIARLHCLTHDQAEAVTGDVTNDWKPDAMREMQDELDRRIWIEQNIAPPGPYIKVLVKYADYAILLAEAHRFGTTPPLADAIGKWLGIETPERDAINAVNSAFDMTAGYEQYRLAEMFVDRVVNLRMEI